MFSKELQIQKPELLRRTALAIGFLTALVLWVSTILKPHGDFLLHLEFAHRLLTGRFLYEGGMHIPYPPAWAMLFLPFANLPARVAMPAFCVVGFLSLLLFLKIVLGLARQHFVLHGDRIFWLTASALLIASRFVLRDLSDGGENLFINAAIWSAIYFFALRKWRLGGAFLGLSIALKCTPLIFCGYLVLKRKWSALFWSLIFASLFFVSPVLVEGANSYINQVTYWEKNVVAGLSQKDPSVGVLGPDELHNKALKPMLVRFLMRLPDDHPGRFQGTAHIDFLRLSPGTAGVIIKIITILSGAAIVGLFSRSSTDFGSLTVLWELCIVCLLMLLFSPITWGQHCVAIIPALILILFRLNSPNPTKRWLKGSFVAVAVVLILLNRSLLGFTVSELLESYHVITFCLITLLAISFGLWSESKSIPSSGACI